MFEDDRTYYRHRAEVEIAQAQRAAMPRAAKSHYQLAEAYLDKLRALDGAPEEQA